FINMSDCNIVVYCIYCPPNLLYCQFEDVMKLFKSVYCPTSTNLVLGDFNLAELDWRDVPIANDKKSQLFLQVCEDAGLEQLNYNCTRGNNILDLVLTNDALLISDLSVETPFSNSDHNSLVNSVFVVASKAPSIGNEIEDSKPRMEWQKADWL